MSNRLVMSTVLSVFALSVAACRSQTPASETETAAPPAASESHEGHTAARVFFVSPKNGETIKSTHRFEFGSDMYQIAAVPEGEISADQVRAGIGHFHLGVDKDCVPAGQEIVRGTPDWVHFGTGSNFIEMQMKPGPHTFSVQVGDDLHRAVEGLCETINVTVAE
jgi:hypothetical protein